MFLFIKCVLIIRDTNTAAEKYSRLYTNVYLYLEFITWAKERRLWFQSLNATSFMLSFFFARQCSLQRAPEISKKLILQTIFLFQFYN
jgi:hypothetical protein